MLRSARPVTIARRFQLPDDRLAPVFGPLSRGAPMGLAGGGPCVSAFSFSFTPVHTDVRLRLKVSRAPPQAAGQFCSRMSENRYANGAFQFCTFSVRHGRQCNPVQLFSAGTAILDFRSSQG